MFLQTKKIYPYLTTLFSFLVFFIGAPVVFAEYQPLADIGINTESVDLGSYLQQMFEIFIGVAIVLAVLMVVIGGVQYMTSEAVSSKSAAWERMRAALFGLLLIMFSVLILNTINPNLLSFSINVFQTAPPQTATTTIEVGSLLQRGDQYNKNYFIAWYSSDNPEIRREYFQNVSNCTQTEKLIKEASDTVVQRGCSRVVDGAVIEFCYGATTNHLFGDDVFEERCGYSTFATCVAAFEEEKRNIPAKNYEVCAEKLYFMSRE